MNFGFSFFFNILVSHSVSILFLQLWQKPIVSQIPQKNEQWKHFEHENLSPWSTFNLGLVFIGFRAIRPRCTIGSDRFCDNLAILYWKSHDTCGHLAFWNNIACSFILMHTYIHCVLHSNCKTLSTLPECLFVCVVRIFCKCCSYTWMRS